MKHVYSLVLVAFLLLQGCATAPRLQNMVPDVSGQLSKNVSFSVNRIQGGSETDPFNISKIESDGFGQALLNGLIQSGLFTSVMPGEAGAYVLSATILTQDQPGKGRNVTSVPVFLHSFVSCKP